MLIQQVNTFMIMIGQTIEKKQNELQWFSVYVKMNIDLFQFIL